MWKIKRTWILLSAGCGVWLFFISLAGRFLRAACNTVSTPSSQLDRAGSGVETFGPERMAQLQRWSDEEIKREFYRLVDTKTKSSQEEEDWVLLHFIMKDRDLLWKLVRRFISQPFLKSCYLRIISLFFLSILDTVGIVFWSEISIAEREHFILMQTSDI